MKPTGFNYDLHNFETHSRMEAMRHERRRRAAVNGFVAVIIALAIWCVLFLTGVKL